jgi:hypothetical protein
LTSAAFSAYVDNTVQVPNNEALVNATHHQYLMLNTFRVSEDLLYSVMVDIDS